MRRNSSGAVRQNVARNNKIVKLINYPPPPPPPPPKRLYPPATTETVGVTTRYGNYIKWACCSSCDHVEPNMYEVERAIKMIIPTRLICPKCGAKIVPTLGRFIIETIPKRWFWQSSKTKATNFIKTKVNLNPSRGT